MKKIIVLGMNRTGTKLAAFLAAKYFAKTKVYLEPFTWDRGINAALSDDWQPQQQERKRNTLGIDAHRSLHIVSPADETSSWLNDTLNSEWDVLKFIEIGRAGLIYRYAPDAAYILLIRHPLAFLASIAGMGAARDAVIEQAERLIKDEGFQDPLPDADQHLTPELAGCARAYHILYSHLARFRPAHGVKISYEDMISKPDPFEILTTNDLPAFPYSHKAPLLGASTQRVLSEQASRYITEHLLPVYQAFLNSDRLQPKP
ncbi:sulfotransferase [Thalassolituus sp. LLYu03]|uniref:sulfotransferase n=1 Tax=Thalassolituus sp. LLYu03 TaxID=3421656 RepID=UPI003D297653